MRKIFTIFLIGLILGFGSVGCVAYYPVKTDVRSLNNLNVGSDNLVFKITVDKTSEAKISGEAMNAIKSLIFKELQDKNIKTQENAPLLVKIHITTYEDGDASLRFLVGLGAGRILIKATIFVTQDGIIVLEGEIESRTPTSLFNIYSGWPATEQGVQETFAREVAKVLEGIGKIEKN